MTRRSGSTFLFHGQATLHDLRFKQSNATHLIQGRGNEPGKIAIVTCRWNSPDHCHCDPNRQGDITVRRSLPSRGQQDGGDGAFEQHTVRVLDDAVVLELAEARLLLGMW
jgi:hypothetical protein